jgi:hypothetical protein
MLQSSLPAVDPGLSIIQNEVFPRLTEVDSHCIAHAVSDNREAPVFRAGDYVVADTTDREPVAEGVYLVEWSNGCRDLMKTMHASCERRVENGQAYLTMRRDGSHTVWYFHAVVSGMFRLCDGPYEVEHMKTKIVGRIVGVIDGDMATEWARRQVEEYNLVTDRQALAIAASLDADLLIELQDRTGKVSVLVQYPDKTAILSACVDHDTEEAARIYKDFWSVFRSLQDGGKFSRAKLEAALCKAGRVITVRDGQWHPDPSMPQQVRMVHFPSECGAEDATA